MKIEADSTMQPMPTASNRPLPDVPWVLLDWGDTVMVNFPQYAGPMTDWPKVAACPGIEDAVAALAKDYNLVLATNARDSEAADIRKALARVGLGEAFDEIFCYREVGHLKPSPAFFQQVIKKLGCQPSDIAMVGDDFEGDIIGATVTGMLAVWYNPSDSEILTGTGYTTVHHHNELKSMLGLLLPNAAEPNLAVDNQ